MNASTSQQTTLGKSGEVFAAEYLRKQGYKILERNYRCKIGEIDLIAEKADRIVFFEVKTRTGTHFGYPEEAITRQKRMKLIRVSQWYLKSKNHPDVKISFHALSLVMKAERSPEIRLIENILEGSEFYRD